MEYIVVIFMLFLILYVISCLCKHIVEGFNIGGEEKSGDIVDSPTCIDVPISINDTICISYCEYTLDLYYGQDNDKLSLLKDMNVINPSPKLKKVGRE